MAFLWQIAPIGPVWPTPPVFKSIAVNKMPLERHLHTVEVAGSNPAAPTIIPLNKPFRVDCAPQGGSKMSRADQEAADLARKGWGLGCVLASYSVASTGFADPRRG